MIISHTQQSLSSTRTRGRLMSTLIDREWKVKTWTSQPGIDRVPCLLIQCTWEGCETIPNFPGTYGLRLDLWAAWNIYRFVSLLVILGCTRMMYNWADFDGIVGKKKIHILCSGFCPLLCFVLPALNLLLYFLQINTISSQLQKLYRDQNSPNIVDDCVAYPNYCLSSPCQNGAPCYNRKDSYYCDCTGMDYANIGQDVCARCKFNMKTVPHNCTCSIFCIFMCH